MGDRYFGHPAHRSASVTIMDIESIERLGPDLDPADTRRNVIVRGLPIDSMRGQDFWLGGIRFRAHRPANPCAWMDEQIAPGAFRELRNHGGIRLETLSDGVLTRGKTTLVVEH